ncbi:MAG: Cys-tRNA(Pro) deacylase [Nocardioidaceae bacterium]
MARGTRATTALTRAGITFTTHVYDHDPRSSSYGLEAAEALDVEAARVFKTLVVDLDGTPVVAIVPVTASLDLKRVAAALGGKRAAMADPAVAERATGYVLGGVSPVGQRRRHRTVLDASATDWDTVLVSGGRRGLDVELSPGDLAALTGAVLAVVARARSR